MEKLTGIHEVHKCSKGEDSYFLAVEAAKECLRYSKHKAKDIEMIIVCSISKYKGGMTHIYEPPFSILIKQELGANKALTFDISNACAGMLTGVYLMDNYIKNGIIKKGMVISGEYITTIADNAVENVKSIASMELASLTVGDAGAAVILERAEPGEEGLMASNFTTLAKYSDLCIGKPDRKRPGAIMKARARKIHRIAISDSPPLLKRALDLSGLTFNEIDRIIPHQTSERSIMSGIKHMGRLFGVTPKNVVINLHDFGNTASTTHFVALYKYLQEGKLEKGERIMLICYASGLVVGVVIFTMDDMVKKYGSSN